MQVSVEKTGDLGRRMTVQVPAGDIDGKVRHRLDELRRQVRLKGFRPGKVPMKVIQQRYGQQVREEVLQQVMQSSLQRAIGEQQLRVAGVSRIQPVPPADGGDFKFTAELEVFPELPEIDVTGLKIDKPEVEITEEDVDDMLQTLRAQRRVWSAADRPSAGGDRVRVEYVARIGETRVPEIGHHEIAPVLGSGALFEQFEEILTGVEAGMDRKATLNFPEDYRNPELAGREAEVSLEVKAVESAELPELDEDFARAFGVEGGVEQLRVEVRRNLEREMREAVVARLKQAVTDGLAAHFSDFSLPSSSVQQEARQLQAQFQEQTGRDEPPPLENFAETAGKRVRLGFLMAEIARQHDIRIDDSRVQEKIAEIADTYEQPGQVVELYRSNDRLLDSVRNMVLEEQVVDWVLDRAAVTARPMSFKELMGKT